MINTIKSNKYLGWVNKPGTLSDRGSGLGFFGTFCILVFSPMDLPLNSFLKSDTRMASPAVVYRKSNFSMTDTTVLIINNVKHS